MTRKGFNSKKPIDEVAEVWKVTKAQLDINKIPKELAEFLEHYKKLGDRAVSKVSLHISCICISQSAAAAA
jgi:hypothetical protein